MTRLIAASRWSVVLQYRAGFYWAVAFVVGLWALVAGPLAALALGPYLPALVLENMLLTTFYFMAGLVLLEKAEGSLLAQVVTPLRAGEYLAARTLTLSLLALLETLAIVVLLSRTAIDLLPFISGTLLSAALYVLVGFVAVARYEAINDFIFPSALYTAALTLPVVANLAGWDSLLLYLHPVQPGLVLISASFEPLEPWKIAYGVTYGLVAVWLAFTWAERAFLRFVVTRAGAS